MGCQGESVEFVNRERVRSPLLPVVIERPGVPTCENLTVAPIFVGMTSVGVARRETGVAGTAPGADASGSQFPWNSRGVPR